jgi:hypothetical protein
MISDILKPAERNSIKVEDVIETDLDLSFKIPILLPTLSMADIWKPIEVPGLTSLSAPKAPTLESDPKSDTGLAFPSLNTHTRPANLHESYKARECEPSAAFSSIRTRAHLREYNRKIADRVAEDAGGNMDFAYALYWMSVRRSEMMSREEFDEYQKNLPVRTLGTPDEERARAIDRRGAEGWAESAGDIEGPILFWDIV